MEVKNNTEVGTVAMTKRAWSVAKKSVSVRIVRREVTSVAKMTIPAALAMAATITVIPVGAVTIAVVVPVP